MEKHEQGLQTSISTKSNFEYGPKWEVQGAAEAAKHGRDSWGRGVGARRAVHVVRPNWEVIPKLELIPTGSIVQTMALTHNWGPENWVQAFRQRPASHIFD